MKIKLIDRFRAAYAAFMAPQITYSQEVITSHNRHYYKELIERHRHFYSVYGNDKDLDIVKSATYKLDALVDLDAMKAGRRLSEN